MFEPSMILPYLTTVRDFIRWGASRMNEAGLFFGHGTDNAIDEAAALVLHTLHLPLDTHSEFFQARLTESEQRQVLQVLQRRIEERIPAPYLMHKAWFMGLPFYVDERVLIPRSPIAEMIERQFSPWLSEPEQVGRILDLCTGSGCIGIACAYAFPEAEVDLLDISADALAVAAINVEEHGLDQRINIVQSDLLSGLSEQRYDLIVSNPPYVGSEEMSSLPVEYQHEPTLALASGDDGLEAVREILRRAGQFLNPNGLLVVEVGNTQQAVIEAFPELPLTWVEFDKGGDGVFLISAEDLAAAQF